MSCKVSLSCTILQKTLRQIRVVTQCEAESTVTFRMADDCHEWFPQTSKTEKLA